MEWALIFKYLLLVLIVLVQIHGHKSCLEEERTALLKLKAFLKSQNANYEFRAPAEPLPSWVDEKESDCCGWERVTCNTTTGHIMNLSLNRIRQLLFTDISFLNLNFSLFQPFTELRRLDLSSNWYIEWIENEGSERRLSVLGKLETLNLNYNDLGNPILPSLSALTSLKTLNLRGNTLEGSFPAQELATLKNLEMLDLGENGLTGTLAAKDMESLSRLKKLEALDLGSNSFNKSIIKPLSALTSLKNLTLSWNQIEGSFPAQELSLLENLETLDVSRNLLNGSLTVQDSKSLSKLSKLKHLNLSLNSFNKESLSFMSTLPAIKSLDLRSNGIEGTLSNRELANLSSLEVFILRDNYLNGTLPIKDLVALSSLKILDLSENNFTGSIPTFNGALSSLEALSLAQNSLNGSLPIQGFCELKKLQELDLSQNIFEGILPPCLNHLTSLRLLDLSLNRFTGNISSSLITPLTSLEYVDLNNNHFKGVFSFSSFANHSKLEVVKITSDDNEFEVETEFSDWVPMFQLKVLVLSNCNLNKLTGDIPKFLLNQHELRVVDLSHNNLKGRLPDWLLQNNTRLEFLNLRNNSFMGQLHLPLYPNINLYWMDVSSNQVGGQLQENIGEMVPQIVHLNLSRNTFEGSIPTSICDMRMLDHLDLSANNFSGEVPKKLLAGCIGLSVLKLSKNSFRGQIFSENFNLNSVTELHLDDNQFTGTLSNVISRCSALYSLDISNNYMSGEIQSWIGVTYSTFPLGALIMRNNSFKGGFPCELVPYYILDLSYNSFSGSLPSCSDLQYLPHIHLQNNKFTGSIPEAFLNSSYILTMDIRDNFLSGSIPDLIGGLSNLRVLLLRGNHLSGLIPNQLCQLNKIGLLDLSRNYFSGSIPHCLNNITFGNTRVSDDVFAQQRFLSSSWRTFYTYGSVLGRAFTIEVDEGRDFEQQEVEFVTKYRLSIYKGEILNYMSGLDLSCNKLRGEIPHELGSLSLIHALNLSHNQLTGPIPSTFSNLTQIESLDLSYNNLSGEIPLELIDLNFLSVFTVAHNNLSGRVPDSKGQFGTFESSSYDGNPFLSGLPCEENCTTIVESPQSPTESSDESERKWYEINHVVFSASFAASYIVFLLGVVTLLYVNPYWRRRWFNLIEEYLYSCYYYFSDPLRKLSGCFHN